MPSEHSHTPAVARVVIIPAAGDTPALDYAIDPSLIAAVRPGVRVLVPLGRRRAIGLVTELAPHCPHPQLRAILSVIDDQPLLDNSMLDLCRWMGDYYLSTEGEALSTALPGTIRVVVEPVVRLLDSALATESAPARDVAESQKPAPLKPVAREIVALLAATGPQRKRALIERFGPPAHGSLKTLRQAGLVAIEERVHGTPAPRRHVSFYRARPRLSAADAQEWQRRRPAQYAVYAYLLSHPYGRARRNELRVTFPNLTPKLNALIARDLVAVEREEISPTVLPDAVNPDRPVTLTAAQSHAVGTIERSIGKEFRAFLLWGVTGSGKTEVYLRSVAAALAAGRTALVLVPEISLTHQVVDRIRARFGDRVAILHSALSDSERWDEWRRIACHAVPIVVGARSAVFAPLPHLGLIVVDEEHDAAYKQEDGLHYNGRDVAVMRAKLCNCPVVLGSATPAMETFHNALTNRYQLLELPHRVADRPLPHVDIVDLRRAGGPGKAVFVSPQLLAALKANQAARGQSLVFLNRRGFANFLQCHQCGETLRCPNCSVSLTLHRRRNALCCHHCEYTIPVPASCPECGGLSLAAWGAGTEQVEVALRQLVPGTRIARMDRDSVRRKGTLQSLIASWHRGDYDILVGTQMVTKGHDVQAVTLVGVLLADTALNFPDFRAAERTFQLLAQVAGRAGRGDRPGRVIVQTLQPQHLSLECARHHDYRRFAEHELAARRELGYPPFARIVQIRCEGPGAEETEQVAQAIAATARAAAGSGVAVLGPTPAPLERLRGRFRWHVLVRARDGAAARAVARTSREAVARQARTADVRLVVDVDPYSML